MSVLNILLLIYCLFSDLLFPSHFRSTEVLWDFTKLPKCRSASSESASRLQGKKTTNLRIYENLQHQLWNKISMFHTTCSLLPNVICVGTRTERCTAKRRWAKAPWQDWTKRPDFHQFQLTHPLAFSATDCSVAQGSSFFTALGTTKKLLILCLPKNKLALRCQSVVA